jgi:DNA primase
MDLDSIKAGLRLADLAGVEVTGRYKKIRCPFHQDDTPSMVVYGDGTFHCYGCQARGDALDWLGYQQYGLQYQRRGDQLKHVIDVVAGLGVQPLSDTERIRRAEESRRRDEARAAEAAHTREQLFARAMRAHQSLPDHARAIFLEWGISDEWIDRARLGWDGRLVIPALYRNVCFGIKRRRHPDNDTIAPKDDPKYTSVPGSTWGLYNADILADAHPRVIVCEDEKSALALCSAGAVAIATTGGAGFWKSQKAEWWSRLLNHIPELIFWRDDDNAGLACALDFRALFPRTVIVDSRPYKDASDYVADGYDWRDIVEPARRQKVA